MSKSSPRRFGGRSTGTVTVIEAKVHRSSARNARMAFILTAVIVGLLVGRGSRFLHSPNPCRLRRCADWRSGWRPRLAARADLAGNPAAVVVDPGNHPRRLAAHRVGAARQPHPNPGDPVRGRPGRRRPRRHPPGPPPGQGLDVVPRGEAPTARVLRAVHHRQPVRQPPADPLGQAHPGRRTRLGLPAPRPVRQGPGRPPRQDRGHLPSRSGSVTGVRSRFRRGPGGVVYDRTKTVVRRHVAPGQAVPLHPEAVAFAGHYDFDIDVLAAYRPTGKGRVERQVTIVRDHVLAGRAFSSLAQLDATFVAWCRSGWPRGIAPTVRSSACGGPDHAALRPIPPWRTCCLRHLRLVCKHCLSPTPQPLLRAARLSATANSCRSVYRRHDHHPRHRARPVRATLLPRTSGRAPRRPRRRREPLDGLPDYTPLPSPP